jgi:ankyrin repeat protein
MPVPCLALHVQNGGTALHLAAAAGKLECLQALLAKGAAVNQAALVVSKPTLLPFTKRGPRMGVMYAFRCLQ